jgi:hypothetical protein
VKRIEEQPRVREIGGANGISGVREVSRKLWLRRDFGVRRESRVI